MYLETLYLFSVSFVTTLILKQVSGLTLSWFKIVLLSLLPTITYKVSPLIGYVFTPIYFMFLNYYLDSYKDRLFSLFCGIYALSVEALFTRFILFYFLPIFPMFSDKVENNILLLISLEVLLIPFHYVFVKVLRIEYGKLKKLTNQLRTHLLFPFIMIMSIYYLLIEIFHFLELLNIVHEALIVRKHLTLLFFLIFLCLMLNINYNMTEELDKEIRSLKDQQLISLSNYSKQVESLYRELRSFRHDYTNILVSLNESIRQGDITQIRQVYDTVIADTDKKFYNGKYDIASLANVKDDAIKSILSAKLIEAQKRGVSISVEVEKEVAIRQIELLDFVTILSIFLDNAIEAAILSANPELVVAYFEDEDEFIFLIENSIREEKINTKKIFHYGYSTKGEDRGIGLANVSQIMKRNTQLSLETSSSNYRFSQLLKIQK